MVTSTTPATLAAKKLTKIPVVMLSATPSAQRPKDSSLLHANVPGVIINPQTVIVELRRIRRLQPCPIFAANLRCPKQAFP
jgi:hypothetical protein